MTARVFARTSKGASQAVFRIDVGPALNGSRYRSVALAARMRPSAASGATAHRRPERNRVQPAGGIPDGRPGERTFRGCRDRARLASSRSWAICYRGTTAMASISTRNSGFASAETKANVMTGGLGCWPQTRWNAANPSCSGCPWTTSTFHLTTCSGPARRLRARSGCWRGPDPSGRQCRPRRRSVPWRRPRLARRCRWCAPVQ
jgi:hypothetical protein